LNQITLSLPSFSFTWTDNDPSVAAGRKPAKDLSKAATTATFSGAYGQVKFDSQAAMVAARHIYDMTNLRVELQIYLKTRGDISQSFPQR
jgi:hypothetical protein